MRRVAALCLGLVLLPAAPAFADHHAVKIKEVFAGTTGQLQAHFVEIQAYAANQDEMFDPPPPARVRIFDATGAVTADVPFTRDMANAANQMTVLAATTQAATFFGITPDLVIPAVMSGTGGRVCFVTRLASSLADCASWGNYTGSHTDSGTPKAGGIPSGMSLERSIAGGNPSVLESGDDTNNSNNDFAVVSPTPQNNAGATTSTAGTVGTGLGTLSWNANAGTVANRVTLTEQAANYKLLDAGAPLNITSGCVRLKVNEVRCPKAGISGADFSGGPGADGIRSLAALGVSADGGGGNDAITTGPGVDSLVGGNEADTLDGGDGPDTIIGGPAGDTVTYATRGAGVVVDLDTEMNDDGNGADGAEGARDTIAEVEHITGGLGDDTLTGNGGLNIIDGGPGGDTMNGMGGADTVTYVRRLIGVDVRLNDGLDNDGNGDDGPVNSRDVLTSFERIAGGRSDDILYGDDGINVITGNQGIDEIRAFGGADQVLARDGFLDGVFCGLGVDKFRVDGGDSVALDGDEACETAF